MNNLDPTMLGPLSMTAGLSLAMVWLAARASMIEFRRPVRCPACGRLRRSGSCRCDA
jgi:hypothetical protein